MIIPFKNLDGLPFEIEIGFTHYLRFVDYFERLFSGGSPACKLVAQSWGWAVWNSSNSTVLCAVMALPTDEFVFIGTEEWYNRI